MLLININIMRRIAYGTSKLDSIAELQQPYH
jgi:hypothetical protein